MERSIINSRSDSVLSTKGNSSCENRSYARGEFKGSNTLPKIDFHTLREMDPVIG